MKWLLLAILLDFDGETVEVAKIEYRYNQDPAIIYIRTDFIFANGFGTTEGGGD